MNIEQKLKEIKERCEAATEGPWNPIDEQRDIEVFHHVVKRMRNDNGWTYVAGETGLKDTLFISHARTDVPMLLEMVERLKAEIKRSTDKDFIEHCDQKLEDISEKYR